MFPSKKNIQTLENRKLQLISMITKISNPDLLDVIESLLLNSGTDWWKNLNPAEQFAIVEGLSEIQKGKLLSHNDVMKEINNRYKDL